MDDLLGPAPSVERHRFADVTSVVSIGSNTFGAEVNAEWTIGGKPNGGYLLAMVGRAAASVSEHGDVIAASAHYLRPPDPGAVTVETEVLRAGRSASQVRAPPTGGTTVRRGAGHHQSARRCDSTLLGRWDAGGSRVAYEDCSRMVPQTPNGSRVALMEQVDVRLEPDSGGWRIGQPSGRGELRGWLALPQDEPFDPTSLLFAVDAFPPATFDIEFTGWVPTLELTAYVRALPAPGPVRVLQRAQLIEGRRVDESCFVWDRRGRLVAEGTQLAGITLG